MNDKTFFRLTHPQKRIWYTEKTYLNTAFANLANSVRYKHEIKPEILEKAIKTLISKHEGLRLRLAREREDSEEIQYVSDSVPEKIDYLDFSGPRGREKFKSWIDSDASKPFTLFDSPLYYFAVTYFGNDDSGYSDTGFYFKLHHIISDGWTLAIVYNQIMDYYLKIESGHEKEIKDNPPYLDYIKYEDNYLTSTSFAEDEKFWLNDLADKLDVSVLNSDKPAASNINAQRAIFTVSNELRQKIHDYKRSNGTTVFKIITAAFMIYISRLNSSKNIAIVTAVHGRNDSTTRTASGMFVGTVPLRIAIDEQDTFAKIVSQTGEKLNYIIKKPSRYPFDMLINKLREEKNPNADTLLGCLNVIGHPDDKNENISFVNHYQYYEPSSLSMHINPFGTDIKGKLDIVLDYQTELFSHENMETIFRSLSCILNDALTNDGKPIGDIEIISEDEKRTVIHDFNRTAERFPHGRTLIDLFVEAAKKYPRKTAIVYDDVSLTYSQLYEKVRRLASTLKKLGVGPEKIAAIYARRSQYYLIAMLAIMKAGGAYLPIDTSYPRERVNFMLKDAGVQAVLTFANLCDKFDCDAPLVFLDDETSYDSIAKDFKSPAKAKNLAYIIYTSGSTGKPKGVMIEHRSAVNIIYWHMRHYRINHHDHCAQFASFAFDASITQTFSPLANGAALYILKDELRYSPIMTNEYFEKNKITYADLPTQFCEQFIRETNNHSLKRVSTGGEKLKMAPAGINFKLIDEYGPTETTVTATYYDICDKYSKTPIGKPISNNRVYILDKKGRPVPINASGELCIAGAGLARGYLNRPELTAEKFVDDPFVPGQKMYRTGDLARWLPDGNIDYMGRIDYQVKIRGFRIELDEIQNEIVKHPLVSDAVVANGKNPSGDDFISAHIILKDPQNASLDAAQLNEYLLKTIPAYMLPSKIAFIDKIPLTSGGKADKKALLAALPLEDSKTPLIAPCDETEKKLAGIWSDLLNIKEIGTADNFFALGGHSLKAASLQLNVKKAFAVEISLHDIFSNPTIKQLAQIIKNNMRSASASIKPAGRRKYYPLSAAQKRLFVMEQISGGKTTYNLTTAFRIRGPLDEGRFASALCAAIKRHAAFGASFDEIDGEPVALIERDIKFKRNFIETSEEKIESVIKDFVKPFDLKRAPLFRTLLIKYGGEGYVFVFDIHHIIFDGISANVFMRDLCDLYSGLILDKLEFDYQDYAVWQNEAGPEEPSIKKQENYWLDVFKTEVAPIEMLTDRPRTSAMSYSGSRVFLNISGLSNDLERLSEKCSATAPATLLALFFTLLHKYCGQSDIVSGVPAAGRENAEFEKTVGMFVNTLAIRSNPSAEKPFDSFVNEVKNSFISALDNQGYQFDRLVEKLGLKRTPGRNPLFDVMFAYEDRDGEAFKTRDIEFSDYVFDAGISKFDLTLFVARGNGKLEISLEYRDSLFEKTTAERFLNHFATLLKNAAENPAAAIGDIGAMEESEIKKLIGGFNSTAEPYPAGATLISLFEKNAAENPDACALLCDGKAMTYSELNEKANRLAWRLDEIKHSKNEIFAILLERSFEMLVSILAVLKAGGAYLPIDPSYPSERIEYIISDSGIKTLLTEKKHIAAVSFEGNKIDVRDEAAYCAKTENPSPASCGEDIIYVIYTSGSTGRPKGVLVKHKGAINYIWWCKKVYAENAACDFPLYSSISFDLTVTSIFTPLICGGKIVIYAGRDKETLIDKIIADDNVDIVKLTPTHLQIIESMKVNCKKIRKFIVGGEDLKSDLAMKIFKKFNNKVRIFNEYGPTETTVGCMIYEFSPSDAKAVSVPIGVPAANTMIYLLGKDLKPVLNGTSGEIYISGDGVARGYLNKSEMSAAKFINDPFNPEKIMYKTGDLARMLPEWNIEFLGRIDDQIKLRGFRIETGEIEAELLRHPSIREAAVILRDDAATGKYLCAYYTTQNHSEADVKELKTHLSKRLPYYFIPDVFMKLESIPITANGKFDRKALPDPREIARQSVQFISPRNDVERYIAKIWSDVLGVKQIGIDDNFFELGGHSLKAVKAAMLLSGDFEISVNDIFEHQSIRGLSEAIKPVSGNLKSKLNELKYFSPRPMKLQDEKSREKLQKYNETIRKIDNLAAPQPKNYADILLCGSTGYLGAHILNELLENKNAKMHLLIRSKNSVEGFSRLKERYEYYFGKNSLDKFKERIQVYAGDLSKQNLALAPGEYSSLCKTIDCIINSAADVRHFGHYQQFYEANVSSVENLIKLASSEKIKDINHISTMSVASGDISDVSETLFSEDDLDIGQSPTNYYLKTKFLAEKALAAARASGINANIFRAGNLTFNSKTGLCQRNIEENAFYKIIKSFAALGYVPCTSDEAEFSFVDCAARAITILFDRYENEIFHILNPKAVKLSELLSAEETGLDIKVCDFKSFIGELLKYCDDKIFRPQIDELLLHRDWSDEMQCRTRYCTLCEKTVHMLKKSGFEWPEVRGAECFEMIAAALGERIEFLKRHPLFAGLPEECVKRAAMLMRETHYKDDETIAWENEPTPGANIITEGVIEISAHSKNSWIGTIAVLGKDELISFGSAFAGGISNVIAGAIMGDVNTLFISNENLLKLTMTQPLFAVNVAAQLSKKLITAQNIIINMG